MSIVRIGLGEREGFAEGWDAIFGKGKKKSATVAKRTAKRKPAKPKSRKKSGRK